MNNFISNTQNFSNRKSLGIVLSAVLSAGGLITSPAVARDTELSADQVAKEVTSLYESKLKSLKIAATIEQTGFEDKVRAIVEMKPKYLKTQIYLLKDLRLPIYELIFDQDHVTEKSSQIQSISAEILKEHTDAEFEKKANLGDGRFGSTFTYQLADNFGPAGTILASDAPACLYGIYTQTWLGKGANQIGFWSQKIRASKIIPSVASDGQKIHFLQVISDGPYLTDPKAVRVEEEMWVDSKTFFVTGVRTTWLRHSGKEVRDRQFEILEATYAN